MTRTQIILVAAGLAVGAAAAGFVLLQKPHAPPAHLPAAKTLPAPAPAAAAKPAAPVLPAQPAAVPGANGGCLPPQTVPPAAPDGNTATEAEMKAGHDRIQAFVDGLEAYQKCLNTAADAPGVSPVQQQVLIDQGNGAIDEAELLAKAFALQLAVFKARQPAQAPPLAGPVAGPAGAPPK